MDGKGAGETPGGAQKWRGVLEHALGTQGLNWISPIFGFPGQSSCALLWSCCSLSLLLPVPAEAEEGS